MLGTAELDQATVADLAAGLGSGRWTSVSLVDACLRRIERLDGAFGAIRCVLDDCRERAAESDDARGRAAARSVLDGVPVIVKDNIDIAGVPTTAGALALEHSVPGRDAPVVRRLREAGAVILAKANLSELANFLTSDMPPGYSSLGGQVLNPYDTSLTPSGSSSGSATAVALGMAPLALGTETDGSITSPAELQSLVGVKPTLGLVSRTGVLPIAPSQDTPGPMTRTVGDAVLLLAAIAGPDPEDPATAPSESAAAGLRAMTLDPAALAGARLGVVRDAGAEHPDRRARHDAAVESLRSAGATLIEVTLPTLGRDDEFTVLHYEFAPAVDAYLSSLGPAAPRRSLAEIRDWNLAHPDVALKFRQHTVDKALSIDHVGQRSAYLEARARSLAAVTDAFEEAMAGGLEALVFPGIGGSSWAARAGWPSVVVPAGYTANDRRPVGLMLVSRPWTDERLLNLAHAFERAHPMRLHPWEVNPAAFRRFAA